MLDAGVDDVGPYQIFVERSTAATTPIACDTPLTDTIEQPLDVDRFSFSVVDGERIQGSVYAVAPIAPGFNPFFRVWNASNQVVCPFSQLGQQECGPLPASGNPYRVEVVDFNTNASGAYEGYLTFLSAAGACEGTNLPDDASVNGTIDSRLETDLFEVATAVTDGTVLSITVTEGAPSGPSFTPIWKLYDAAGIDRCNGFHLGPVACGPLTATGNPYRVLVIDSQVDDTGAYSVLVQR